MVGRVGALELGAVGLGGSVFFLLAIVGIGVVVGLDPLVSQAHGAGDERGARRYVWQGLWLSVAVSLPLGAVCVAVAAALPHAGIADDTSRLVLHYVLSRLPGLYPMIAFTALRAYLQSEGTTRPLLTGAVLANAVNIPLSWFLVLGDEGLVRWGLPAIGLPALGVVGAGLVSSFASWIKLGWAAAAIARIPTPPDPGRRRLDPAAARRVLRVGVPVGLHFAAEVGGFAMVTYLMGRLGAVSLAAHHIAISLAATTFMVPLGISGAASVRVGQAVGRADTPAARRAGTTALGTAAAFMACCAAVLVAFPSVVAGALTDQADVVAAALPLLRIAAFFQVFDGLQVVAAGALRGAGDTRSPFVMNLAGYYVLGLPIGLWLAHGLGRGAVGLWWGLLIGLAFVAVTLSARFARVASVPIARLR